MILFGKNEGVVFSDNIIGKDSQSRLINQFPYFKIVGQFTYANKTIKRNLFQWKFVNMDNRQYKLFTDANIRNEFCLNNPGYIWESIIFKIGGGNFHCASLNQAKPFREYKLKNWKFRKNYVRYYKEELIFFESVNERAEWIESVKKQIKSTQFIILAFGSAYCIKFIENIYI